MRVDANFIASEPMRREGPLYGDLGVVLDDSCEAGPPLTAKQRRIIREFALWYGFNLRPREYWPQMCEPQGDVFV